LSNLVGGTLLNGRSNSETCADLRIVDEGVWRCQAEAAENPPGCADNKTQSECFCGFTFISQGLKAAPDQVEFAARLKACPDTNPDSAGS